MKQALALTGEQIQVSSNLRQIMLDHSVVPAHSECGAAGQRQESSDYCRVSCRLQ